MYHFFIPGPLCGRESAAVGGSDYNHIKNVLRMKTGERLVLTGSEDLPYLCEIAGFEDGGVILRIIGPEASPELKTRITLFQGLPKGDKMDTVIQKAVELGAAAVVPVEMKRCVVRLDEKKKEAKVRRWQAIAASAAKQSGRGYVPQVGPVMGFKSALKAAEDSMILFPYENAEGMDALARAAADIPAFEKVSVFIGPEGGFDEEEVALAGCGGARVVSLGKRILRTETAGAALLAFLMLTEEINSRDDG